MCLLLLLNYLLYTHMRVRLSIHGSLLVALLDQFEKKSNQLGISEYVPLSSVSYLNESTIYTHQVF